MKKLFKILMVILIIVGAIGLYFLNNNNEFKTEVSEFNNYYNDNNIEIFYEEENKQLLKLNKVYKVDSFIEDEENELNKVLKIVDIVNSIAEYDEVKDSGEINAVDILENVTGRKKMSGRDMAIIYRDLLYSINIKARVGEFKNERSRLSKDKAYYVVEYWSSEYSKWVMIDFIEKGYFLKDDKVLSATEIINYGEKNISFKGKIKDKEYKNRFFNIFETYTISIDNTLNMKKSNSVITYVKNDKGIYLEHANKYLKPTIFTKKDDIFLNTPQYKSNEVDSKPYIIMMKQSGDNTKFTIAAFMNGKILDEYYLKVNKSEFVKETQYSEIELSKAGTTIEVSLDGKKTDSKIVMKLNY